MQTAVSRDVSPVSKGRELFISPPMELIPLIKNSPEYKNFLKVCSWTYDWHEWFLFGREH